MRCYAPSSMAFVCAHRSYKMVDVEKCPYIEYKIQGLSGIIAKEEKIFCVKDDLIMQIELKQEGLEITGLKVQLYCGFSIQIARKPNMSLAVHW